jgi:hypothetical protein
MGRSGDPRKRNLRPGERARQDQLLAATQEVGAASPRTAVCVTAYAEPGEQCSWCDCPDGSEHEAGDGSYVCDQPCPQSATYRMHLLQGSPREQRIPVCDGHSHDAHRWVRRAFGPIPAEVYVTDIRDGDG